MIHSELITEAIDCNIYRHIVPVQKSSDAQELVQFTTPVCLEKFEEELNS